MPTLRIRDEYSHLFGKEVLRHTYRSLYQEICGVLCSTSVPLKTKPSREKTKQGRLVYSGKDFNSPLAAAFKAHGWGRRRIKFSMRNYIDLDLCKERVAVEVQFGKYAFVPHNFSKFQYLFEVGDPNLEIDVGVEIVPSKPLFEEMYSGPANFETVISLVKKLGRNRPPIPMWIIGLDVTRSGIT